MRALILVAGAALAVSACSSNDSANNTMNVDENMMTTDMNTTTTTTTDMNAADMNATADMNAMDMNATSTTNTTTMTHDQQRDVIWTPPLRRRWLLKRLPVTAGSLFFWPCSLGVLRCAPRCSSPPSRLLAPAARTPRSTRPECRRESDRRQHRCQRRDRD